MEYELPATPYGARDEERDPQSPYRLAILGAGIAVIVMAIGLYIFASNTENREMYHGWYLLAFFVFTTGFGAAIGMSRPGIAVLLAVFIAGILGVSMVKFDYRSKIIKLVNTPGNATLLGDYVQFLPPWEHEALSIGQEPKWVKFDTECYRPLMREKTEGGVPDTCTSKDAIQTAYNINLLSAIQDRYALMRSTAQQIEKKEILDKTSYEGCIAGGTCAQVPLLPEDAKIEEISNASPEYRQIRNAFWQLIDSDKMDASLCEFISLCQAMFKINTIKRTDFESSTSAGTVQQTAP